MSNVNISPNMNLPVPIVSVEPGPDWAEDNNACLGAIDSHNHSSGQGVQITPSGININADLAINGNNINTAKSVIFNAQVSPLSGGSYIGCIYVSGKDLYYNDEDGNQVRITTGGNVNAGAGSISGLPSGTASVSFAAGTYTFQSATSTPATMAVGPVKIGNQVASSKTVTISPNASIAANYNFVLPASLPAASNYMTLDNTGAVSYNTSGSTGNGAVVLDTSATLTTPTINSPTIDSPTFTGTPAGVIIGASFSPTITWSAVLTVNRSFWYSTRTGPIVTVNGYYDVTNSSGAQRSLTSVTIPVASAAVDPSGFINVYVPATGNQSVSQLIKNISNTSIAPFFSLTINNSERLILVFNYSYTVS